jgi:hypothetical protein
LISVVTTGARALRTITTRKPFFKVARVISESVAARAAAMTPRRAARVIAKIIDAAGLLRMEIK